MSSHRLLISPNSQHISCRRRSVRSREVPAPGTFESLGRQVKYGFHKTRAEIIAEAYVGVLTTDDRVSPQADESLFFLTKAATWERLFISPGLPGTSLDFTVILPMLLSVAHVMKFKHSCGNVLPVIKCLTNKSDEVITTWRVYCPYCNLTKLLRQDANPKRIFVDKAPCQKQVR